VADLVVGVIGDVLRHIAVEVRQRGDVRRIATVHSSELVVLLPEVALDQLGRGEEPQDRDVALRDRAAPGHRFGREQSAARYRRGTGQTDALQERAPPDDPAPLCLTVVSLELWMPCVGPKARRDVRLARVFDFACHVCSCEIRLGVVGRVWSSSPSHHRRRSSMQARRPDFLTE
jgi:hypothetical protein